MCYKYIKYISTCMCYTCVLSNIIYGNIYSKYFYDRGLCIKKRIRTIRIAHNSCLIKVVICLYLKTS